jgi:hypothetical protein
MARYSKASRGIIMDAAWMRSVDEMGEQLLRQRDAQRARQNQSTIQQERKTEVAKKNVPMNEWLDIARQMKDNPAMRARLAELISAGQVDISVGADGNLRVRADEVGNSPAPSSSVTSSLKPTTATPQLSGRELAREVGKLADSRDYKVGLERKRAHQELTSSQQAALVKMGQLEALSAAEARAEKPPLPGKYSTQPEFASRRIRELVANPDGFARINDAREYIAEIRATKGHAAFDEQAVNHKHAREELRQLYELAYPPESFGNHENK